MDGTIEKFASAGEKTGWTYIRIPFEIAQQLNPGNKKTFRVKGKVDKSPFEMVSLLPMGGGDFIMTLNARIRKSIRKPVGEKVRVHLTIDKDPIEPPSDLMQCLADEPKAMMRFQSLTASHRNYFINWIKSAKTTPTLAKRIAATIHALEYNWDFGQLIRSLKKKDS